MPDLFRCRCGCLNPILCNVPLGDGSFAMARYRFVPSCPTKYINFESTDYTPAWTGAAHDPIDDTVPFFFCDDTVAGTATMTASGRDVGDVEIKIFDEDDVLIARFLNDVYWQPNCTTQFVLVEYEPACGEVWDQFPCLQPIAEPCYDCLCSGDKVVFTVQWSGVDLSGFGPDDAALTAAANQRVTLECVDEADPAFGVVTGDCLWQARNVVIEGPPFWQLIWLVQFLRGTDGGGTFITQLVGDKEGDPLNFHLSVAGTVAGDEDNWCENGPWSLNDVANPLFGDTVVVNAVTAPDGNNRPDIRYNCDPANDPVDCNGESLWTLKAWTLGALYLFYWELDSDTCTGAVCNNAKTCEPAPPFDVPTYLIDEGQATSLEILDLLNDQIAGYCGCVDPYVPPEEPNYCTGTSTWTLRRTLCEAYPVPGDHYLYYWDPGSSTCDGLCSDPHTCNGQPPYALATSPLNDTDAGNLGYLDALDEEDTGGTCSCDDPYVPPNCPECEDCDDVPFDKTFTVGAYTFTLTKGASPCGADPCCWAGSDGANGEASLAFNVGVGTWEMTIAIEDPGSPGNFFTAGYTGGSDPCDDPIVLSLTGGDPGFSWPATITVSNV